MQRPAHCLVIALTGALCAASLCFASMHALAEEGEREHFRHVLLISVDGLHDVDVQNYVHTHRSSTFARLQERGVRFANASSALPSDSFPGLIALVSGASPRTSGVYYDDSYDRKLSPPGDSQCLTHGTEAAYAENLDQAFDDALGGSRRLDAGGGINPALLPRDANDNCAPVYPHQFLRVNTIFNVAHDAGLYTAWSDKHPAYELVRGRANTGAQDLYTPEINSPPHELTCTRLEGPGGNPDDHCAILNINQQWTSDVSYTTTYDDLKVQAVLNQIRGFDHTGKQHRAVPAIFGMNFQCVSVGEKLTADGYADAAATPSAGLATALQFVDASLGRFVAALRDARLLDSTLIIVAAKHGQSPIDIQKLHMKPGNNPKAIKDVTDVTDVLAPVVTVAQATEDDISLIWLKDQDRVGAAVAALQANSVGARVQHIYSSAQLKTHFGDPLNDSRAPDLIVQPIPGTIYSKSAAKIAEHGGFSSDDTHVALIISSPRIEAATVEAPVSNQQVAPTILKALGLPIRALDAVRVERTRALPGIELE